MFSTPFDHHWFISFLRFILDICFCFQLWHTATGWLDCSSSLACSRLTALGTQPTGQTDRSVQHAQAWKLFFYFFFFSFVLFLLTALGVHLWLARLIDQSSMLQANSSRHTARTRLLRHESFSFCFMLRKILLLMQNLLNLVPSYSCKSVLSYFCKS